MAFYFQQDELGTAYAVTLLTLVRSTPPFLMLRHLSGVVSPAKFDHQTHIFHIIFETPSLQAISYCVCVHACMVFVCMCIFTSLFWLCFTSLLYNQLYTPMWTKQHIKEYIITSFFCFCGGVGGLVHSNQKSISRSESAVFRHSTRPTEPMISTFVLGQVFCILFGTNSSKARQHPPKTAPSDRPQVKQHQHQCNMI